MPPRKHGPTPKAEHDLQSKRVVVHFNEADYTKLTAFAGSDIPRRVAAYVRTSALQTVSPVATALNREAWQTLAPALANLNQIARKLNTGNSYGDSDRIDIIELTDLVKELRGKLL